MKTRRYPTFLIVQSAGEVVSFPKTRTPRRLALSDRRPLGRVLPLVLKHQPDCPLANFRRISCRLVHNSILSRNGVSGKPGAIQIPVWFLVQRNSEARFRNPPATPNQSSDLLWHLTLTPKLLWTFSCDGVQRAGVIRQDKRVIWFEAQMIKIGS